MKKTYRIFIWLMLVSQVISSCTKMDSKYEQFIKPGGVSYVGKAVDPVVYNGRDRVKISWLRGADPKVTNAKIFWNNFTDSIEVEIPPTEDTVNVLIEGLEERTYAFVIRTYDHAGNISVPVEVLGKVYGENYQSSLLNRVVLSSIMVPGLNKGKVFTQWADSDASNGAIANEIAYTNVSGDTETIRLPSDSTALIIDEFKPGTTYRYRTLFLPDSLSIDTFYTDYHIQESIALYGELPNDNFRILNLPTDAHDPNNPNDWSLNKIWDKQVVSPGGLAQTSNTPRWFSIDLGIEATITRLKLWQSPDRIYMSGNPKVWEVWGSNNPDADGGWENWTLLTTCESVKPSGLPLGQNSAQDYQQAAMGEEYLLPSNTPAVRYLRFKVLESWEPGTPYTCIAEMAFFTFDR